MSAHIVISCDREGCAEQVVSREPSFQWARVDAQHNGWSGPLAHERHSSEGRDFCPDHNRRGKEG